MVVADALASIRAASGAIVGQRSALSTVDDSGRSLRIVNEDPTELADAAGLDLDTYALARMVSSEEGSGTPAVMLALAEAARNEAARRGVSVSALLLASRFASDGKFSEQLGKWASTREDPNGRHVAAAVASLSGSDFALGARDFFDPSTQDRGRQDGHKLSTTSEEYIAQRAREGLAWVGELPGIDAYHLMLFAPAAEVDTSAALALLTSRRPGGGGSFGSVVVALALVVALSVGA